MIQLIVYGLSNILRFKMSKRMKVGINGFGRIGRCVTRILAERDDIDLGEYRNKSTYVYDQKPSFSTNDLITFR